jgi:sulfite reductase (ferredoxin)
LSYQSYEIDTTDFDVAISETLLAVQKVTIEDTAALKRNNRMSLLKTSGLCAIGIKKVL